MSNDSKNTRHRKCSSKGKKRKHKHQHDEHVYGEFIRTFTFSDASQLPIVQPGGSLVFPIPTAKPVGVHYIDSAQGVGLLVPRGVYSVLWKLNPSDGASVDLLVNGASPVTQTTSFAYAQSLKVAGSEILSQEYLITAPLKQNNLVSLVNGGTQLFTLDNIPNTKIGNTSVLTQVTVKRINSQVS
jgi:hypothetical protein